MSFTDEEVERYARHLVLREVGGPGQQRLKGASVLIVGAGGLGSPAALYLAAAGVGAVMLADPDVVDRSNLQRQIIYAEADLGRPKTEAAADRLAALNPHVFVAGYEGAFDAASADELVADVDLVLDGTDDFATRFAVNAACVRHGKTLVSGAIGRWTGQIGVFLEAIVDAPGEIEPLGQHDLATRDVGELFAFGAHALCQTWHRLDELFDRQPAAIPVGDGAPGGK